MSRLEVRVKRVCECSVGNFHTYEIEHFWQRYINIGIIEYASIYVLFRSVNEFSVLGSQSSGVQA